jgi:hypothetical protein
MEKKLKKRDAGLTPRFLCGIDEFFLAIEKLCFV